MGQLSALLRAIPLDKYIHFILSVLIFAAVHFVSGDARAAFVLACVAHVIKKADDYWQGSRDWPDIAGDVLAGVLGAAVAWACLFVR